MMQIQIPDPADVGLVGWLLCVLVVGGVGAITFFMRRMVSAMDRMATAQEATPASLSELRTLLAERLDKLDEKLDRSVSLADQHLAIARLWEKTEAVGRSVRSGHGPPV
jgi:hypothetical protein